jgi:hypothetical protein
VIEPCFYKNFFFFTFQRRWQEILAFIDIFCHRRKQGFLGVPPFPDPPKWANSPCKTGFLGVSYSKVQEKWSKKGVFGPKKQLNIDFWGGPDFGVPIGIESIRGRKTWKTVFFDGFWGFNWVLSWFDKSE